MSNLQRVILSVAKVSLDLLDENLYGSKQAHMVLGGNAHLHKHKETKANSNSFLLNSVIDEVCKNKMHSV